MDKVSRVRAREIEQSAQEAKAYLYIQRGIARRDRPAWMRATWGWTVMGGCVWGV